MIVLATQEECQLCAAAARQHIEDIQLLQVLQESGVDEVTAKRIFHTEVN